MNSEPYFNRWKESWVSFGLGFIAGACLVFALMLPARAAEKRLPGEPMITVIALYNGPGVPEGWIDSTTRDDATDICNKLIANMSKEYATPIARARCIIKVQEKAQ